MFGAGGAVAAAALRHVGEEASERLLGPREKVRLGAALALASERIGERSKRGEPLRSDGFFLPNPDRRSDAEEVAESVLLKAQREPEEKKIPYMANFLAAVAFDPQISASMAHQITTIAEQLTYRQLAILKLAAVKQPLALRDSDYHEQGSFPKELYQVLYECFDLYQRGLINFGGTAALGLTEVRPAAMTVQGLGVDIFNLMLLNDVPIDDIIPIAQQLGSTDAPGASGTPALAITETKLRRR